MRRILLVDEQTLRVVGLPGGTGLFVFPEIADSRAATTYLQRFEGDQTAMVRLREVLAEDSLGFDVGQLNERQVVEAVAHRVETRQLKIANPLHDTNPLPDLGGEVEVPPPPPPVRVERGKSWVEFLFTYPDNKPVGGLDYVLEDPDGVQESGTLGDDGKIRRDGIPEGNWTAIIRDVESAVWTTPKIKCDDAATVHAKVSGYVYGTPAKVNIYRELKETKKDIIKSLSGRIENDTVDFEWTYDYASTEERKAETGIARFIAEVEVEGGKHWAKTLRPLEVELKSIKKVAWSATKVMSGGSVTLLIETAGYPDGTEAKLELWSVDGFGEIKKEADLDPVEISEGKASVPCRYGASATGDIAIRKAGEYFVGVRIEDQVKRSARSELLWCMHQAGGAMV